MTTEDKELLLKDLCARLPYNVTCRFTWTYCNETTDGEEVMAEEDDRIRCIDFHIKDIQADYYGEWVDLENCKPYLRPMSSITEEEVKEFETLGWRIDEMDDNTPWNHNAYNVFEGVEWLNKKMFDFRGLIPMGLALEAKEGMYKTE